MAVTIEDLMQAVGARATGLMPWPSGAGRERAIDVEDVFLYAWTCQRDGRSDGRVHDRIAFLWDGVGDAGDAASVQRATLLGVAKQHAPPPCRCGLTLIATRRTPSPVELVGLLRGGAILVRNGVVLTEASAATGEGSSAAALPTGAAWVVTDAGAVYLVDEDGRVGSRALYVPGDAQALPDGFRELVRARAEMDEAHFRGVAAIGRKLAERGAASKKDGATTMATNKGAAMEDEKQQQGGGWPRRAGQAVARRAAPAALRTAGRQAVALARDPIVALLGKGLGPSDRKARAAIARFLESEAGAAALGGLLGVALEKAPLPGVPAGGAAERAVRTLGLEMQTEALSGGMDMLVEPLMAVVRGLLTSGLLDVVIAAADDASSGPPAELPEPARADDDMKTATGASRARSVVR